MATLAPEERLALGRRLRERLRVKHYALSTERSYVSWIKQYLAFHQWQHPSVLAEAEINAFLTFLAARRHVAVSTQTQALSAVSFLWVIRIRLELGLRRHLAFSHLNYRCSAISKRLLVFFA